MKKMSFWIFFLAIESLLLSLGVWQIQRLQWKEGLLIQQEKAVQRPPVPFSEVQNLDEKEMPFTAVTVTGIPAFDKALWFGPKNREGKMGYHFVMPVMADGRYVVVDMGFQETTALVPPKLECIIDNTLPPCGGGLGWGERSITLTGILRLSEHPSFRAAKNAPEQNFWQLMDVNQIASTQHLKPFWPVYVMATTKAIQGLEPNPRMIVLRNQHLHYAITWFSLAILIALLARKKLPPLRAKFTPR